MESKSKILALVTDYVQVKSDQLKLRIFSVLSKLFALLISFSIIVGFGFFVLLFLNFYLSNLINNWLESTFYGYLIIAGFYIILLVIALILIKKEALQNIIDKIIIQILEKDEEEDI